MDIQGLGYIGVRAKSLETGQASAPSFLGMQLTDRGAKSLALRMDDRKQRVVVSEDGGEGVGFLWLGGGGRPPPCRISRRTGEGRCAGGAGLARARRPSAGSRT